MTKTKLNIGPDLGLPLDAITQTFGVLAVRGAGKSNLAAVMAEEMFVARLPFVVIDPVGSWYGLRAHGSDAKAEGLPIPIFGGRHGDVPLERTGGQLLADLVVDRRMTCVLDVSEFSEGDKVRFLIDFAERLYRRNTEPLHLFLEEADDYAPQRPMREQARLLGAWQNIVRRGRARGLGITMITQRSAVLNKDVLTQIETLFVLRTTSPQDRKAIEAWVAFQGGARDMIETLPRLESGEAWVWSPSWLRTFERVHVRRRWTFDSGATPKGSKATRPTASLADVDLGSIREQMAATIERAKADDPRELRRRIGELEKQAKAGPAAPAPKLKEVPALSAKDRAALERTVDRLEAFAGRLEAVCAELNTHAPHARATADSLRKALGAPPAPPIAEMRALERVVREGRRAPPPPPRRPNGHAGAADPSLPKGERITLIAIAQHPDGVTREQLTVLTGYKRSTRDAYLQRLRERGHTDDAGGRIVASDSGVAALGSDYEPLPTGDALREHWLEPGRLPEGEARVLDVLCAAYPKAVAREKIDEATGFKRSTRDAYLQRLGARRLVSSGRDGVIASAELFG